MSPYTPSFTEPEQKQPPEYRRRGPAVSMLYGVVFSFVYWLAVATPFPSRFRDGSTFFDNFYLTTCTLAIPPLIAPFVVDRIRRSAFGIKLSVGGVLFCGYVWSGLNLAMTSAIFMFKGLAHRIPATLVNIDRSVAVSSCILFLFLSLLLTLPGRREKNETDQLNRKSIL